MRTARPIACCTATFLLVSVAGVARAQDGAAGSPLAYRADPGRVAAWRLAATTTGEVSVTPGSSAGGDGDEGGAAAPTEPQKIGVRAEVTVDYRTTDADPDASGRLAVDVSIDRLAVKRSENGRAVLDLALDEAGLRRGEGEPQPLEGGWKALVGAPLARIHLAPTGAPASVERIAAGAPPGLDVGTLALLLQPALPAEATSVGARWRGERAITTELELADPAALTLELELIALEDGEARIRIGGTFERASGRATNARGVGVEIERLTIDAKGEATLDLARGQVVAAHLELEQRTVVRPDGAGEGSRVSATLSTRYELTERDD